MLQRDKIRERPPSRISGLVYILLGMFALFISGFVALVPGSFFGVNPMARVGFAVVIGLYGGFRIFTGIAAIRKAAEAEGKYNLNGKSKSI
ncbi:MAG: hypothetical protein Q8922_11910 [Bacteroidota bacterium]|nr:hypothetical protein [Bacteroidota bacterium]MDP4233288.1 hypothetical protein [Bacteroidota bacterium]MDP4242092.1 hypothetical protein [Bacteroidota bacterium]MDP4288629.1 hypothetical protein [Bacteroidota bacterium]